MQAQLVSSLKRHAEDMSSHVNKRAEASFLLAQCYLNRFGVPEYDDQEGLRYLRRAAELGHSRACEVAFNVHHALQADMNALGAEHLEALEKWIEQSVRSGSRIAALNRLDEGLGGGEEQIEADRKLYRTASLVKVPPKVERIPLPDMASVEDLVRFMDDFPDRVGNYNEDGDSLLHWAAARDIDGFAEIILSSQPNLQEATNNLLETPLLFACRHGSTAVTRLLLQRGARKDTISLTGETPLHWLAAFPDDEVDAIGVALLDSTALTSFALANAMITGHFGDDFISGTPLNRAVALRRAKVVKFLLHHGADPFYAGTILFDREALVQAGYEPIDNDSGPSHLPVHWACQAHDVEMLALLTYDWNFVETPEWPTDMELLAETALDPDLPPKTMGDWLLPPRVVLFRKHPTAWAKTAKDAMTRRQDGLGCELFSSRSLLGYACDPFPRFFRLATHGKHYKDAMKIIDNIETMSGQDIERVSYTGLTAIMQAARNGDIDICLHLLSKEQTKSTLETSYKGGWGMKPLHIAGLNNDEALLRALLVAGANPSAERSDGGTALQVIATQYFPDQRLAEVLLDQAPDLVSRSSVMETPLSTAVRNLDFGLADLLLRKGAGVNQLIGPHQTNTVLFQVLAGGSTVDADLEALRYLLRIPNIDFVVAPRQRYTALHAAVVLRARYSDVQCAPSTLNLALAALLQKWHSKPALLMQDHKGNTALHYAAIIRDTSSIKLLVEAMEAVGATLNTLSTYFGSPVNRSVLDALDLRSEPPSSVIEEGDAAVDEWHQQTAEMRGYLTRHGAKHRQEVLQGVWDELSFWDKRKANLLSSQKLATVAQLAEVLDLKWSLGPDVKWTRERIEAERNPDEIVRR